MSDELFNLSPPTIMRTFAKIDRQAMRAREGALVLMPEVTLCAWRKVKIGYQANHCLHMNGQD